MVPGGGQGAADRTLWPIFWGCLNLTALVLWLVRTGKNDGVVLIPFYALALFFFYGSEARWLQYGSGEGVNWSKVLAKGLISILALALLGWFLFDRPASSFGPWELYGCYSTVVFFIVLGEWAFKKRLDDAEKRSKGEDG